VSKQLMAYLFHEKSGNNVDFFVNFSGVVWKVQDINELRHGDYWASQATIKELYNVVISKGINFPFRYYESQIISVGNVKNYDYYVGYNFDAMDEVECLFGEEPRQISHLRIMKETFGYFRNNPSEAVFRNLFKGIKLQTGKLVYLKNLSCFPRSEIFQKESKEAYIYDINSCYPYILSKLRIPYGKAIDFNFNSNISMSDLEDFEGFAKVNIYLPKNDIGIFPYKLNFGNQLSSRLDSFVVWIHDGTLKNEVLNFADIRFLLSLGCEIEFLETCTFLSFKLDESRKKYLKTLYLLRDEYSLIKKSLNRVVGKIGSQEVDIYVINPSIITKNMRKVYFASNINGNIYRTRIRLGASASRSRLLYSYVVSSARNILTQWILNNKDDILYCDTDSVHFSKEVKTLDSLVGDNLGDLKKLEVSNVKYFSVKRYEYMYHDKNRKSFIKKRVWSGIFNEYFEKKCLYNNRINRDNSNYLPAYSVDQLQDLKEMLKNGWRKSVGIS
jgi:hypothetical protein